MVPSSDTPTAPEDLSDESATLLTELSTHDLRETIVYAQELLHARHEPTLQIRTTSRGRNRSNGR